MTSRKRAILIQLARLGDLVQSLPAYVGIRRAHPGVSIDVLCPVPLTPIADLFPAVGRALGWDGGRWREWGCRWEHDAQGVCGQAAQYLTALVSHRYDVAYNLNQHGRAIVAAHLCASRVRGPGAGGVLSTIVPPWAAYLRHVAATRGVNRVHLADAFCGLCGVRPPSVPPRLEVRDTVLPADLSAIGSSGGCWIALAVGAGDAERVVPPEVWRRWIAEFLAADSSGQVVLVGAGAERDAARAIQDGLTGLQLGRVWDTTGRLSLAQLAVCLQRCRWVLGGDTGPMHLGAALGARAMGWYVARARVHETGPYGAGHAVWQAEPSVGGGPRHWPIEASLALLLDGAGDPVVPGWSLWQSRFDEWGTMYSSPREDDADAARQREAVWQALHPVVTEVTS